MAKRCYTHIDLDSIATDLYFLAEEVGTIVPNDQGKAASLKMYNGLIEILEDNFFDGDIKLTLTAASVDPDHEFHTLWNELKLNNLLVRTGNPEVGNGNVDAATDPFGATTDAVTEVFAEYAKETPAGEGTTTTNVPSESKGDSNPDSKIDNDTVSDDEVDNIFPEETAREAVIQELGLEEDTRSIKSLIRDLLGPKRAGLQDNLIGFFSDTISNTYIDAEVKADGSVKGFTSVNQVANDVRGKLENITTNFIKNSADEVFTVRDGSKVTTLLYFEPGRPMGDSKEVRTVNDAEGNPVYTEYSHQMLADTDGVEYKIIIPASDSMDADSTMYAYAQDLGIAYDSIIEDDAHMSSNLTIDSNFGEDVMTNKVLQNVFFAQSILKGNNYNAFLKAFNKPLHDSYKDSHREGHGSDGTFSAEDQDSKTIRLLKTTTPRLLVDNDGNLSIDQTNPYLTMQDFNAAAAELHLLPRDKAGFVRGLEVLMNAGSAESDIYTSIYHRFFNPNDFSISNKIDEVSGKPREATYRSLTNMLDNNVFEGITREQYLDAEGDMSKLANGNANLDNAITAMLVSLSSTTPAEKIMSRNNQAMTTNTRGGEIMAQRKADIISRTTYRKGDARYTRDGILKAVKIIDGGNAGGGDIKFSIKQPGSKGYFEFEASTNPINDSFAAKGGRFLQSVTSNKEVSAAQMQELSRQFNMPLELLSPRNIPVIKNVLESHFPGEANAFNTMYANLMMTEVLNGNMDNPTTEAITMFVNTPSFLNGDGMRFDVFGLNHDYREALGDIFNILNGRQVKKFIVDNNNNKLATLIPKNKVKDTKNLVAKLKDSALHKGRLLTSGKYLVGETYSKTGIKLGDDAKSNSDMTRLEQNQFLIEQGFLGRLMESNWKSALFQMGTMSDRSDIQLIDVKKADTDFFSPNVKEADLLQESYVSKKAYFDNIEATNIRDWGKVLTQFDAEFTPTNSVFDMATQINNAKLDYDALQAESGLVANGMLSKGKAVAVLSADKANPYQLADLLTARGVDIGTSTETQELVDLFNASKFYADGETAKLGAKGKATAAIPNSVLQNVALFKNEKLAKKYIKANKETFFQRMEDIGYNQITPQSALAIGNKLGLETPSGPESMATFKEDMRTKLLEAYYYHSSTIGAELLDMHTGGFLQFKSYTGYKVPAENIFTSKADGTTEMKSAAAIVKEYSGKMVLDKKTNTMKPLSAFSVQEAAENFGIDSEEVYQLTIIKNKKKGFKAQEKADLLFFSDLNLGNHLKFVDQVKRNAGMGSSSQLPRLAGKNEAGVMLSQYSKNITVNDPEYAVRLLGKSKAFGQDIYDAVQMAHPLYFLKLNGSIGDKDSNFRANGVAVKDITNEIDADGWFRFQKKATFDMFNNEMLRDGSSELYDLFNKMNSAVTFAQPVMMVDTGSKDFSPVTNNNWLIHGTSIGLVLDTETGKMVDTKSLLNTLQNNSDIGAKRKALDQFRADLIKGRYHTNKVATRFNNMQELWEHFGETTNPDAWTQIAELLGNQPGNATRLDLEDASYLNRDAYIEKVGFVTQEKTGNKNVLPPEAITDPNYSFVGDTGNRYSTIDNTYHGIILQAEHNPDTTGSIKDSISYDGDHGTDSTVSLITQIISANVGQGESLQESQRIYDTLNTLSSSFLLTLADKIATDAAVIGAEQGVSENAIQQALEGSKADPKAKAAVDESIRNYVTDMVRNSLKTREDAGTTGEILSERFVDRVSYDLKMTLPLAQSSINSEFNRNTVRMKFKGGQFVVAPSHDFIKSYSVGGRNGLNRTELNRLLTSVERGESLHTGLEEIVDALPKTVITETSQLRNIKPSDILLDENNNAHRVADIKKAYRLEYIPEQDQSFEAMFELHLAGANYATKLIDADGNIQIPTDERLKWQEYHSYKLDEEGNVIQETANNSREYAAFSAVDAIAKNFDKVSSSLDGTGILKTSSEFFDHVVKNMDISSINDIHIREWWFSPQGPGADQAVDGHWTPAQDAEFQAMIADYEVSAKMGTRASANTEHIRKAAEYEALKRQTAYWIGAEASSEPFFRKTFEKHLYDLMEDTQETHGWVAEPAEFYMPCMTMKAFYINENDNLMDILGSQDQPDTKPLISLGIISQEEAFSLEKNDATMLKDLERRAQVVTQGEREVINKYLTAKEVQKDHMGAFFGNKVREIYTGEDAVNTAFIFEATTLRELQGEVYKKLGNVDYQGNVYNTYMEILGNINTAIKNPSRNANTASPSNIVNESVEKFISDKAARLTNNFTNTLEFITARIPAQGKQSYIAAKTKNFIHNSKNSCYGPLEMLTITGADYDIDKQNMMAWSIDDEGNIVDWKQYLDENGTFNRTALDSKIEDYQSQLLSERDKRIANNNRKIDNLKEQQAADAEVGTYAQDITKLSIANDNLVDNYNTRIESMKKAQEDSFVYAGQNYVIYNLLKTIKDPKNAIEAATPVSMDKVGSGKTKTDYTELSGKTKAADYFIKHDYALPYDPYTFTNYERINMDGKVGIGIFASDLKSYFAAYYAFINSTADEKHFIEFDSGLSLDESISSAYDIQDDAIQFFKMGTDTDGNEVVLTQNITELANTAKHLTSGKAASRRVRDLKYNITKATPEAQIEMLSKYIDDVKFLENANVEEQAWEDLSELLSAATDNAKELILGRIGATGNTNSIISTMIRLGVDLKDALFVINHPTVKPIVQEVEKQADLQLKAREKEAANDNAQLFEDSFDSLEKMLEAAVEDMVMPANPGKAAEEYLTNPIRQVYKFTQIANEFSTVASMLSINQGLPNGAFESWHFIDKIDRKINDKIENFSLKEFVSNSLKAKSGGVGADKAREAVQKVMNDYNAEKDGINVPYILYKNSHYFSYFQAAFKAKDMRDAVSSVYPTVERVIDKARLNAGSNKLKIDDKVYKRLTDFVYAAGIQRYFKDSTKGGLQLHGSEYDLSTSNGRLQFIEEFPDKFGAALDGEFKGNDFLLFGGEPMIDYATKRSVDILRGPDLSNIDSMTENKLDNALNNPENGLITDPELYNALFAYGLITGRGGYNKGSFIGLFKPEKYMEFVDFIKANSNAITSNILVTQQVAELSNPSLVTAYTTTPGSNAFVTKSRKGDGPEPGMEDFDPMEIGQDIPDFDGDIGFENADNEQGPRRTRFVDVSHKAFDTYDINRGRNNKDKKNMKQIKDNYIRSRQNGMLYSFNEKIKMFVPLVRDIPEVAIPGNLQDTYSAPHIAAGYVEGWRITMPDGSEGNIMSYVDKWVTDHIKDPQFADMFKDIALEKRKNYYIVKNQHNKYQVLERDDILENNPSAVLKQNKVIIQQDAAEYKPRVSPYRNIFKDEDGNFFSQSGPGRVPTMLKAKSAERASGGNTAMYSEQFFKDNILNKFTKENSSDYSISKLDTNYKLWRNNFMLNALANRTDYKAEDLVDIVAKPSKIRPGTPLYKQFKATKKYLDIIAPISIPTSNIPGKLDLIRGGKSKFKALLDDYVGDNATVGVYDVKSPKTPLVSAQKQMFKDKTTINNMTLNELSETMNSQTFRKYMNQIYLPTSDYKMVTLNDGRVYSTLDTTTDEVEDSLDSIDSFESREIKVPEDLRAMYSKETSPLVLKKISKFLNKRFPDTKFSALSTAEIESIYGSRLAKAKGFAVNGEVVINTDNATLETPIHEYSHIYLAHLKEADPKLYNNLMELSLKHPIAESVADAYPELTGTDVGEEAFSELLSLHVRGELDENNPEYRAVAEAAGHGGLFTRVLDYLGKFFSSVFGYKKDDLGLTLDSSLAEAIDKIGDSIAYGEGSVLNDFSKSVQKRVKLANQTQNLTIKESLELLKNQGFIQYRCQ